MDYGCKTNSTTESSVVFTNSLANGQNIQTNIRGVTNGILFAGNTGTFYGTNVTLSQDVTIPATHSLTIPRGATLTIPAGITFADNGTVTVNGTITRGR